MSNSLDPDQAQRFVGPDLGPNCFPRLSADDCGRQRIKHSNNFTKFVIPEFFFSYNFTKFVKPDIFFFSFYARHAESKKPMHRELGFIRLKPGTNQVAFMIAQNTGT